MTPGRDDDPRDPGERPRKSWREIDAARDRARSQAPAERRARGPAAEARATAATQHYLRRLEGTLFSKQKGGKEEDRLAGAVRKAHGTPELAAACAAYREALGVPEDLALLALFLDAKDATLLVAVLDALLARAGSGVLPLSPGLRTQLRLLVQSADDAVAERAEALLEHA